MKTAFAICALTITFSMSLAAQQIPHVVRSDEDNSLHPAPGYEWVAPQDPSNLDVRVKDGLVLNDDDRGFHPAPGYEWVNPQDPNNLDVRLKQERAGEPQARVDDPPTTSSNGSTAGRSPSPITMSSKEDAGLEWLVFGGILLLLFLMRLIRSMTRLSPKPQKLARDSEGYEEVRDGVPHVGFRWIKNGQGFEVALKNKRSRAGGCLDLFRTHPPSRIKVTKDAIVINGKRLRPKEFWQFQTGEIQFARGFPEHIVGYNYGGEVTWLPGVWGQVEADEIVLGLNLRWQYVKKLNLVTSGTGAGEGAPTPFGF